jgi:D-alanine-D-alanine ligase
MRGCGLANSIGKWDRFPIVPATPDTRILVLLEDASIPSPVKACGPTSIEYFEGEDPVFAMGNTSRYAFDYLVDHRDLPATLARRRPPLVFNLCDQGFNNDPRKELHIPALCEVLGLPYTGAPPACLVLAFDKVVASAVARSVGVLVPHESLLEEGRQLVPAAVTFPLLVKPNFADGSFGIFRDSFVRNQAELLAYLERVKPYNLGPLVLQEYLPGTEYCVVAIGNPASGDFRVLPVLEKDYSAFGADYPPITGFEVKWWAQERPFVYELDLRAAHLSVSERETLERDVERLFRRFECRDYAKFDFRRDADGRPRLIDVNPNFDLFSDSLAMMADLAGSSHAGLIDEILDAALRRYPANGVNQSG